MKHWYFFKSKDKKIQGYCQGEVARFAGYSRKDLVIKKVSWNGKEFTECQETG